MCTNPVKLPNISGDVACQKCQECRRVVVNDWVGRSLAESKTSWKTMAVTLTYGADARYKSEAIDHPNAHVLTYSDVQDYLKRLRIYTPGTVRFLCTGEYGSAKGRAHWHLLLFFPSALPPNVQEGVRFIHDAGPGRTLWPHGWSYWEEARDAKAMWYVCKYIVKAFKEGDTREHRYSKVPPLGYHWFLQLAERYVEAGLSPQDYVYAFGDNIGPDGNPFQFTMSPASAYYFAESFMEAWEAKHKNSNWPQSDLVDSFYDERARRERRAAGVPDWSDSDAARQYVLGQRERRREWLFGLVKDGNKTHMQKFLPDQKGQYKINSRGS